MADFRIKAGDSSPPIAAILEDGRGGPVDLTTATSVTFKLINAAGATVVTRPATILDRPRGAVRHTWQAADTATAGDYTGLWVIAWQDGTQLTVPNAGSGDDRFTIEIAA